MSDISATLAILVARPDGLVPPLECAATQDFTEPWELLVVNWGFGEQDELVRALWKRLRPEIPLRHVPLLPPLYDTGYGSWEMGTTYNTAWAHAQGSIIAIIADFWVFMPSWLRLHVAAARSAPSGFFMGMNHALPIFDVTAPFHYDAPGAIIMENFSHRTALAWSGDGYGAPEWPTRHPESNILPFVLGPERGIQTVLAPSVPAWHLPHYGGGNFAQVMKKVHFESGQAYAHPDGRLWDGQWTYYPVRYQDIHEAYNHLPPAGGNWMPYRRNLKLTRKAWGYWT